MDKLFKFLIVAVVIYGGLRVFGMNPLGDSGSGEKEIEQLCEEALLAGNSKIVLLLTGTDWCPFCQSLDRAVSRTTAWRDFTATEVAYRVYEYPSGGAKSGVKGDLLERFQVEGYPTMVVLDRKGEYLGKRAGYESGGPEEYMEWVRSL